VRRGRGQGAAPRELAQHGAQWLWAARTAAGGARRANRGGCGRTRRGGSGGQVEHDDVGPGGQQRGAVRA
jgi:hypothetical protein